MLEKILLVFCALSVGLYGASFYRNQNERSHLGGGISKPKIFWLTYTIFSWFFLPFFLLRVTEHPGITATLQGFLLLFWVRGILELLMLYRWKNWKPPYGITHDLVVLAFLIYMQLTSLEISGSSEEASALALSWIRVTSVCMVIEVYYAFAFFRLSRGMTTGEAGIWFADPEDPVYRRINRTTAAFNLPLYLHIFWIVGGILSR